MAERYEAGETYAEIARSFGVSKVATKNAVLRHGGEDRSRYGRRLAKQRRAVAVRARYESGERLQRIAADLGISFTTARLDLIAAGGQTLAQGGFKAKPLRGPENPSWTGGVHVNAQGYRAVWIPEDHPMTCMTPARTNYVLEHRLVMAEAIGRPLDRTETVHHINGDKQDNRLGNLQLRSGSHGPGAHFRCHDCGSQNVGPVAL